MEGSHSTRTPVGWVLAVGVVGEGRDRGTGVSTFDCFGHVGLDFVFRGGFRGVDSMGVYLFDFGEGREMDECLFQNLNSCIKKVGFIQG